MGHGVPLYQARNHSAPTHRTRSTHSSHISKTSALQRQARGQELYEINFRYCLSVSAMRTPLRRTLPTLTTSHTTLLIFKHSKSRTGSHPPEDENIHNKHESDEILPSLGFKATMKREAAMEQDLEPARKDRVERKSWRDESECFGGKPYPVTCNNRGDGTWSKTALRCCELWFRGTVDLGC